MSADIWFPVNLNRVARSLVIRFLPLLGARDVQSYPATYTMDNHRYADTVAMFMQQHFQSRLAIVTGQKEVSMPEFPKEIDPSLREACLFAVERCLCAFTNPST